MSKDKAATLDPNFYCPPYSAFFSAIGTAAAVAFTAMGAGYGTSKAAVGICAVSVVRPDLMMKSLLPIIMAGIIGIYGLIISIMQTLQTKINMPLFMGLTHLGSGLTVGLSGLAAGFAIGVVGDLGVRGSVQQPKMFIGMLIILIFAEVLALYGFIVSIISVTNTNFPECKLLQ